MRIFIDSNNKKMTSFDSEPKYNFEFLTLRRHANKESVKYIIRITNIGYSFSFTLDKDEYEELLSSFNSYKKGKYVLVDNSNFGAIQFSKKAITLQTEYDGFDSDVYTGTNCSFSIQDSDNIVSFIDGLDSMLSDCEKYFDIDINKKPNYKDIPYESESYVSVPIKGEEVLQSNQIVEILSQPTLKLGVNNLLTVVHLFSKGSHVFSMVEPYNILHNMCENLHNRHKQEKSSIEGLYEYKDKELYIYSKYNDNLTYLFKIPDILNNFVEELGRVLLRTQ